MWNHRHRESWVSTEILIAAKENIIRNMREIHREIIILQYGPDYAIRSVLSA